ncbi:class I SAM-dependent methyltransferase [Caulobacter sp. S45]|uniref:class I SAM-dependent methyltransferase n=1 Tax=Caulobacter sp. S45 TaxID=1641861 RepID=UPI001575880B|nr:class I SAM-dependent methyltransferase [Caulobacter sp. S45]
MTDGDLKVTRLDTKWPASLSGDHAVDRHGFGRVALQENDISCVYGAPLRELAPTAPGARQISPLFPGAAALEEVAAESLDAVVVAAPPGSLERRYVLALALQALKPGAELTALAPKDKGGARLGGELRAFGCEVEESGRRHHRICRTRRPQEPTGLDAAREAGAPRRVESLGWTQPGLFSWDRPDPGSRLLIGSLPALGGRGADLGCGAGLLSQAVLAQPAVSRLALVDSDRRAIEAARLNVEDPRASFHWTDARSLELSGLDFVVTNPPFHDAGREDRRLGQAFIAAAHGALRTGGVLWLVANRHLPYEEALRSLFATVVLRAERDGFKVYEAHR